MTGRDALVLTALVVLALVLAIRAGRTRNQGHRNTADPSALTSWAAEVASAEARHRDEGRWISRETVDGWLHSQPPGDWQRALRQAGIRLTHRDLRAHVATVNEEITQSELATRRQLFDTIERRPLTEEQARAVVCFDNRVRVVAAAGSGKTSVMIARAGYAIARGFVAPGKVLLLAFNKAAADELQERVQERLTAVGIDASQVKASTFHAFGLDVLAAVDGRKPRVARWLDGDGDIVTLRRIADELCEQSPSYRERWDLFRLLYASTVPTVEEDDEHYDRYDRTTRRSGYATYSGHVVKSHGERLIANWLHLNGVRFEYEKPFPVNVADERHGQYRPDFYYPDVDLWHEHWAIGFDGKPPKKFTGYADSMRWKRDLHRRHGTRLIESTWTDVVFGDGLERLGEQLAARGVALEWDPGRAHSTRRQVSDESQVRLMRAFMIHVKSRGLDRAQVEHRLATEHRATDGYRTRLFLDLFWPLLDAWNECLRRDDSVDFEDMLVMAADAIDNGRYESPYEMVLVDELQDTSHARARVVQGLLRTPERYLLAVGDDWQAINRFAGADLSVMTDFARWFGDGPTQELTTTFRCAQSICDVASSFVVQNPRQLIKEVRSAHGAPGTLPTLIQAEDPQAALGDFLERIATDVTSGTLALGRDGRPSVMVLGRYRHDRRVMPRGVPTALDVHYRTVHSAKGLEADLVVVAPMEAGDYGFPSTVGDDPVLGLVMTAPDGFEHAEERRLFYVALTRARHSVTLIARPGRESPFVNELIARGQLHVVGADGTVAGPVVVCPECAIGMLVKRTGHYGEFYGCSRFPACNATRSVEQMAMAQTTGARR